MNKYPVWWNTTLTIFNRYEDPTTQQITWYKTVISGCFWKIGKVLDVTDITGYSTIRDTNTVICRIPKHSKYVSLDKWLLLPDKSKKFTLQPKDIIVKGKVNDTINEYQKGSHSSDLIDKYKNLGVLQISNITDNSDDARNIPHYSVT